MRLLLTMALIGLTFIVQAQTIRVANNNANAPEGAYVYPTLQEALDAADPGDSIYVAPSPTSYGSVEVHTPVTLVGVGLFPDAESPNVSSVYRINVYNASGTRINGISNVRHIQLGINAGSAYTLSDIIIENCHFAQIRGYWNRIENIRVSNCINFSYPGQGDYSVVGLPSANVFGTIIANNIFTVGRMVTAGNNAVIKNNLFVGYGPNSNRGDWGSLDNCLVFNNIYYRRNTIYSGGTFDLNTFSNNMTFQTFPESGAMPPLGYPQQNFDGGGNLEYTDPMYGNVPVISDPYTYNYKALDLRLDPTSPALNGGTDGTDIGPTGGAFPFMLKNGGSPKGTTIPVIVETVVPAHLNEGEPLKITIKATSN